MLYVSWGILSDKESPALSVEAYALALLEPRRVFGGKLELQILSEQLGFRYYVFSVPSGLTVHNERAQPVRIAVEGPSLVLLFHAQRQHYDLIHLVKRRLGQAMPVLFSGEGSQPGRPQDDHGPPGGGPATDMSLQQCREEPRRDEGVEEHSEPTSSTACSLFSWSEQLPPLPHFVTTAIGRVSLPGSKC